MFEAKLPEAATLKKIIDAIQGLLTEATWDCTDNGVALQAMDSSHVALVSLRLEADGFNEFRCDRSLNLGVNLANMQKILKCANNSDSVTLRAQDEADVISFLFESEKNDRQCEFEIKLMDLDTEHLGIPDQEYDCTVNMSSAEFQRICRDLSQLGDSMTITCAKSNIQFRAKGDIGEGAIRLHQGAMADNENEGVTIEMTEPVNATFAIKYLNLFCKASPLSDSVQLKVSNNQPIVVRYDIGELGHIRFFLAPKIDDEETNDS